MNRVTIKAKHGQLAHVVAMMQELDYRAPTAELAKMALGKETITEESFETLCSYIQNTELGGVDRFIELVHVCRDVQQDLPCVYKVDMGCDHPGTCAHLGGGQ